MMKASELVGKRALRTGCIHLKVPSGLVDNSFVSGNGVEITRVSDSHVYVISDYTGKETALDPKFNDDAWVPYYDESKADLEYQKKLDMQDEIAVGVARESLISEMANVMKFECLARVFYTNTLDDAEVLLNALFPDGTKDIQNEYLDPNDMKMKPSIGCGMNWRVNHRIVARTVTVNEKLKFRTAFTAKF